MAAPRIRAVAVPVGGANFGSLERACERIGIDLDLTADPDAVIRATHVILPGVGAAGPAMKGLQAAGLDRVLRTLSQPVLGICLGMQLMFEYSEEGDCETLGLMPGRIKRLVPQPTWPHMGWNTLTDVRSEHPLLAGIDSGDWFYFVHGYATGVSNCTLAASDFGLKFTAVAGREQVFGVQFHPEKSSSAGLRLLQNFFAL